MFTRSAAKEEQHLMDKDGAANDDFSQLLELKPPPVHLCVPSCNARRCLCSDCCAVFQYKKVMIGHAFDFILFRSDSDPPLLSCTDAMFSFTSLIGIRNCSLDLKGSRIYLELESKPNIWFPIVHGKVKEPQEVIDSAMKMNRDDDYDDDDQVKNILRTSVRGHNHAALSKLAILCTLGEGTRANIVVRSPTTNGILAVAPCFVHLWSSSDRIFVCDIDGTITKSNMGGLYDAVLAQKYDHMHDGICPFLQAIVKGPPEDAKALSSSPKRPTVRILYLSSRPLGLAFATRKFLYGARQNSALGSPMQEDDLVALPSGPLLGFTGSLGEVLQMELIDHSVHEFKTETLHMLLNVWKRATTSHDGKLFYAGMGNTFMDAQAYHQAGMNLNQIYIINKKSEIRCLDRPWEKSWVPKDRQDYQASQQTLFPFGYRDKNIVSHVDATDKGVDALSQRFATVDTHIV